MYFLSLQQDSQSSEELKSNLQTPANAKITESVYSKFKFSFGLFGFSSLATEVLLYWSVIPTYWLTFSQ